VSKAERDRIFGLFQHTEDVQVIVAQPQAMSHGLTLVKASTIIWYAPVTRPDTYVQANGRITRPGQKCNTLIIHIEGSTIERRMYERLKKKESAQGLLLQMIREGRDANC
jgi:SNF2 family DNA or RNA helicase